MEDKIEISAQDLIIQSQTDKTKDPLLGFEYAKKAYEIADTKIEKGMAARQAAFRATQSPDLGIGIAEEWFKISNNELSEENDETERELIATKLLEGRSYSLTSIRLGKQAVGFATKSSQAFETAEDLLQKQHIKGKTWDRYGTMLSRHRATHEAINGESLSAIKIASSGIFRAIRSRKESSLIDHSKFVTKQFATNSISACLAIATYLKPQLKNSSSANKLALRLLG